MNNKSGENVFIMSKNLFLSLEEFKRESVNPNNHLSFNPINKGKYENPKNIKSNKDFFQKYHELSNIEDTVFYLEEELVNYLKDMLKTNINYNFEKTKIYQDDFFNEEYVEKNILGNTYIKNIYSVTTYDLIYFIINQLEKQMFDSILIQQISNQEDKNYFGLKAPLLKNGFIEILIKNSIEDLLNIMYKENSIGFSYIAEKLVSFDIFIIYLILKNFPFFVLTRSRLENLFNLLKKFKSFPYPIGSIGMDLFKLLINELYLPGVTIFQEIRENYFLDIIDPKIWELNCDDFMKVISFDRNIFLDRNKNENTVMSYKLSDYHHLTITALAVFAAYILYNSEDKKESDREEQYFINIKIK